MRSKKKEISELKPVLLALGGEELMNGALGGLRGNKGTLDPSAEISIGQRQNAVAIDMVIGKDVCDFFCSRFDEALTDSTGFYSLEPGSKSTEGGAESVFLRELEMGVHKGVVVIKMLLVLFVDRGVNKGCELVSGVGYRGPMDD